MKPLIAFLDRLIGWIAAGAIGICFALLTFNVAARYVAPSLRPNWVFEVCVFLIVWVILLGVARVEKRAQHIRVDFLYDRFGDNAKKAAEIFALVFAIAVAVFFIYSGWLVVQDAMIWDERTESTLHLPFWIFYLALSVSFAVHLIFIIGLLVVLTLLALGIPIYLVLIGVSAVLLVSEGRTIAGLGQHMLDHLQSSILISVPFFILAAVMMQRGNLANILFDAALAWIGWIRGGLAISGIAATAVFAAITGSSAATTMAMGTLLVPLMVERGNKPSFAMGLTAAAGTLGILIPPSLPMILFGLIAEESIPRLFLGGVIPGLMQAGLFALYIFVVADRVGGGAEPMIGRRQFVQTNVRAIPAYMIPIVVLGGIYGGFVTLTEAAVLGVFCALIAVLFVYRTARLRDIPKMFTEAVDRTSVIVLIIMGAPLVSAWIIKSGVPQSFAATIIESDLKPWQFLLIMNGCMLILGMFLEGVAIILIVLPVVFVVVRQLGIDMTHFAVVMVINIELALLSPPIGLNLFVMSNVTGRTVSEVLRGTIPFFLIMLGLLMMVTFIPALSTWLPNLVLGS